MTFPETQCILVEQDGPHVHITLNRPGKRNAMSLAMVREIKAVFDAIKDQPEIRSVVLRGADGHFCAGGDIKDMAGARAQAAQAEQDPFYALNREFGHLIQQVQHTPQVVIAVLEGAVLGGGFGLACVSDVALAAHNARFALPETGLGIIPAQIAPFVVTRVGLTQARRLALLGLPLDGHQAQQIGLVHEVADDADGLNAVLQKTLDQVRRCAPQANAKTKQLILRVGHVEMDALLDQAAHDFSQAVQGAEGSEGTMAFVQKRKPQWAE